MGVQRLRKTRAPRAAATEDGEAKDGEEKAKAGTNCLQGFCDPCNVSPVGSDCNSGCSCF